MESWLSVVTIALVFLAGGVVGLGISVHGDITALWKQMSNTKERLRQLEADAKVAKAAKVATNGWELQWGKSNDDL